MPSRVNGHRIVSLSVRGFRGILNEIKLQLAGKSLLLFGENGSGKSSFIDALEKLFTDKVSFLDGRAGRQGLSSDRYGPHIHASGADSTSICVEFDDRGETCFCLGSDAASLPADIKAYLIAARTPIYILRRFDILKFLDSRPKDRYELLRPFLPLTTVDQMESKLREARQKAKDSGEKETKGWNEIRSDLSRFFNGLDFPETPAAAKPVVTAALSKELAIVNVDAISDISDIPVRMESIGSMISRLADVRLQADLGRCLEDMDKLCRTLDQLTVAATLESLRRLGEEERRHARIFYEVVLAQGMRWIKEEHRADCPLCEQKIQPGELAKRIEARLEEARGVVELRRAAESGLASLVDQIRKAENMAEQTRSGLAKLPEALRQTVGSVVSDCGTALTGLKEAASKPRDKVDLRNIEKIYQTLQTLAVECQTRKKILEGEWVPPDDSKQRLAQQLNAVKDRLAFLIKLWQQYEDRHDQKSRALSTQKNAERLYEVAETARKNEIQSFYNELAADIDHLFTRIHPEERLGGFKLEVREVGQGSVEMVGDYYDRSAIDVRGYYSEAHLDTLGLCAFLALRKWEWRRNPEFNLLILDDVLLSVDQGHGDRLAKVLFEDFKDYQIVVTTHNKIWYEQLIEAERRCGVEATFVNREIRNWSITVGPDICDPVTDRDVLEQHLKAGGPADVAAAAGRLLEHVLQEMRFRLELSVPAKRGERYELGSLWPAFNKKIKNEYPAFYTAAQKTLEDISSLYTVRNWVGAHFNAWASSLPKQLSLAFGKSVADFYDALYCDTCGRFVEVSVTPRGQLSCRCGKRIYTPAGSVSTPGKSREAIVAEAVGVLRHARLTSEQHLQWRHEEVEKES